MDGESLYKSIKKDTDIPTYIGYYIITESISANYCDLKSYGIKIEKTTFYDGGVKIIETKQINNAFYRKCDADEFVQKAAERAAEPASLKAFMENYIAESLDRARQKI